MVDIRFTLNGDPVSARVSPALPTVKLLRETLGLTGTKPGCSEGECGACTVYLDGLPANSCLVPTVQVRGREVHTVESVEAASLQPFLAGGATQCGACTPGVVMTATWIRRHPEMLAGHSIRALMAGNLCRCTGYDGIVDSIVTALQGDSAE